MVVLSSIEDLARKLSDVLPPSLKEMEQDIQQAFKAILQSAVGRLDLVTREEFEVQTKVLARTREKLEGLQRQVDILLLESTE